MWGRNVALHQSELARRLSEYFVNLVNKSILYWVRWKAPLETIVWTADILSLIFPCLHILVFGR